MFATASPDLIALLDEVTALLAVPTGRRRLALARVEHTLTSGYAHALGLEAEQLRLERQLRAAAEAGESGEVVAVSRRIAAAGIELAHLRGLLATLRSHAFDHRAAG